MAKLNEVPFRKKNYFDVMTKIIISFFFNQQSNKKFLNKKLINFIIFIF
jgi:hypothetical protein